MAEELNLKSRIIIKIIAAIYWFSEWIKPKCKYRKFCKHYNKTTPYCKHDGHYKGLICGIRKSKRREILNEEYKNKALSSST
jgi:putative component of membrane protein insertase Oxa1/YidC/SpoIIIJ protein YidD